MGHKKKKKNGKRVRIIFHEHRATIVRLRDNTEPNTSMYFHTVLSTVNSFCIYT